MTSSDVGPAVQNVGCMGYSCLTMANTALNIVLMCTLYGLVFLLDVMRNSMANR